ncbi:MAG TPA: ergothioneine biosynthesis protein EgtB [Pirellulales bacterium]|jgi:ergothioneine biosynthesis protein EgtB|nr:ergothioneine biosynthesis protein EgtB [Pirellulales bacterium]
MSGEIASRFLATRRFTEQICRPLEIEDFVVQAMPDASPTRWHLAHSTWFFETFVLARWQAGYQPFSADFQYLFNSYYNSLGEQFPRNQRGLLTRPTVAEVFAYRRAVDERMNELLASREDAELSQVVELGIQHEQQHQELILTDLKYLLSCNPLAPVYRESGIERPDQPGQNARWKSFPGGIVSIGYGGQKFSFDNERPRHQVLLQPFELSDRLVTCGEYLEFMNDGGYRRPEFWLSLGWSTKREQAWVGPLYWTERDGQWHAFTLSGIRPVRLHEPVVHVSYFEADAFARWRGARLPSEAEWEHAAAELPIDGSFAEREHFHPVEGGALRHGLAQLFGEVWQWTQSPYTPYPGYAPPAGALGEYNGKFMCNQYVLRGGSCVTPASHIRATYRNFFPPEARWQFSGIRLASDSAGGVK